MATDSSIAARPEPRAAQFENELPTYRALSALAITSAAAGLIAGLSFVAWWWLGFALLAVVAGSGPTTESAGCPTS